MDLEPDCQSLVEGMDEDGLLEWAKRQLAWVDLGDSRRDARLPQLLAAMAQRPGKTLPEQCESPASLKAAYRLLQCEEMKPADIVSSSAAATVEQIRSRQAQRPGVLLCIQDTTSLNYSSHQAMEGRGPISKSATVRGFFAHSSLLVGGEGVVHGLLECEVYARDEAAQKARKPGERNRQQAQAKESARWLRSLEQCAQLCERLPEAQSIINIADREADMYDLFMQARRLGQAHKGRLHVLIRAQHDRQVQDQETRLWEHLAGKPAQTSWDIELPAAKGIHGQQSRQVEALWQRVRLEAPAHQRKYQGAQDALELSVIMVREPSPPKGEQALEWVLLSTLEVQDAGQARQMVRWYALRWQIEVMHRIWKSGCRVEQRRFRQARAAQAMIVLDLLNAVLLLGLVTQSRHDSEALAGMWLSDTQQEVLRARFESSKTGTAGKPLKLAQAVRWIAQLAGHRGAPSSPSPGPETLWRGLARLQDMEAGWELFQINQKCG